jgi:selenide,water dikinase
LFYGLAVTGVVERQRIFANTGAKVGDQLVLTKPLGSGLVVNGLRGGKLTLDEARPVLQKMAALNRAAAQALDDSVHAATDVTGFGLVGHALNIARGSKVALRVKLPSLSVYPHALDMHKAGVTTKSTKPNREAAAGLVHGFMLEFADALVHDPQTSGGLLIATSDGEKLVSALRNHGVEDATIIGEVLAGEPSITFTHGEG